MKSFILFKNAKIHYKDFGKGKAIVLLHGFLENSTMWNDFINEWSRQNRIITIDLLGHGKSECLGYVHSMELMAEAVAEVLSHLKIKMISECSDYGIRNFNYRIDLSEVGLILV